MITSRSKTIPIAMEVGIRSTTLECTIGQLNGKMRNIRNGDQCFQLMLSNICITSPYKQGIVFAFSGFTHF